MQPEAAFILLFVVATAVAIAARRWRLPYTVALVLAGVVLGTLRLFAPPHLTKELLFAVFLPGLLFEAAFHLHLAECWRNRVAIVTLAVPGVMAAIALTAALLVSAARLLGVAGDFTWQPALVFGALIAATDPVAVVALFKSLGVPPRLATLIEGESLLNDGTAIVFFTLILDAVLGHVVSPRPLLNEFLAIVGTGTLVGVAVGLGVSTAIRRLDDPMIEITLTTIAAYGSFLVADQLHASGVIATVVAGVICSRHGARTGMSTSTRVAVATFWEYIAFALNSLVFLLIGFEVALPALVAAWPTIGVAYGAVTLGRGLVSGGGTRFAAAVRLDSRSAPRRGARPS